MKALAVDIGGTHANCAIVEDRTMICSETIATQRGTRMADLLPSVAQALKRLAGREGMALEGFAGIAMGFCGLVNGAESRVFSTNGKYEDAPSIDLQGWARERLGLPLFLENDARLALLGEWYAGAARGVDDVVMVTLGTGIGAAAMMAGRVLVGKHFQAGCLGGHLPVRVGGDQCTCGSVGCAESEAAGWSLPHICRKSASFESSALASGEITFEALFRHANAGDAVAVSVLEHCLQVWATNAIALIHAYDPELLIYGGGVMRGGEQIVHYVQNHIARYAWTPWGTVQVRRALLDNRAALLGAIPLILERKRGISDVR